MVPPCSDRVSRAPPYSKIKSFSTRTGLSPLSSAFPNCSGSLDLIVRLVRFRSPLLAESRLISFPLVTKMFQFTRFAPQTYLFSSRYCLKAVGCPIQISADQRLLSSPRSFSQSATSFFASYRQGIHQMPLTFLITMCMSNLIN